MFTTFLEKKEANIRILVLKKKKYQQLLSVDMGVKL